MCDTAGKLPAAVEPVIMTLQYPPPFNVVHSSLIVHKISLLRDSKTKPKVVRELIREISTIMMVDASRQLDLLDTKELSSPLAPYRGCKLKSRIGLFPILRAGLGMVDACLSMIPTARIYHLGLYRDKSTLVPVEYYNKLPSKCDVEVGYVLDPMVATAGTAIATINILKDWGLTNIVLLCIMSSREGLIALKKVHPDVQIYVAAVDSQLTDSGYIIPGMGDSGDRQFKTDH